MPHAAEGFFAYVAESAYFSLLARGRSHDELRPDPANFSVPSG